MAGSLPEIRLSASFCILGTLKPRADFEYTLSTVPTCRFSESLNRLFFIGNLWGGRRGLNPRHSVPQTDALPAELLPPLGVSLACKFGGGKVGDGMAG